MGYILKMENITKIYGNGIVANRDVDFTLQKGEIHALVGENGAGKSTLMKILFGMEKPSSGKIILNDKEIDMNSSNDAIAYGIGMVHQHFMLVNSFTVAQNIMLGIEPKSGLFVDKKGMIDFTRKLAEKYNFDIDPTAVTGTLAVGIKQKIEILKALARGAQILILDEPTAVLTPQETEQLFEQLKALKQQGYTIVFISHKIKEVKEISDRISIMRAGKSEGVFKTSEISEKEISNKIVGWNFDTAIEKNKPKYGEVRIKISDLTCYGNQKVPQLNHINLQVRSGMILGVAGVQGNGQVELVEVLTKRKRIEQGSVEINHQDVSGMSVRQIRDNGFSYIPEDRLLQGVAESATISENMISNRYDRQYCKHGFLQRKKIADFVQKEIENYQIKCDGAASSVSSLSGGNMQKVVVARECLEDIDVLVAEQPTRGVDIGASHIIHQNIVKMRDAGCAVLLLSADMSELMKLSDVLVVMYEGEIVAFYDDLSQLTEEELGLCMLGSKRHEESRIRGAIYE